MSIVEGFFSFINRLQHGCGNCFLTIFLLIFGAAFGGLSYGTLRDYWASGNWSVAQGQVISAEMQSQTDSEGDTTYRAYVTYFYYAGDQRLTHDRVKFGDSIYSGSYDTAQDTLNKYPPETAIQVYYDPQNPQNAVIERTITTGGMLFAAVGVGSVLMSLLVFLWTVIRPILGFG
jgi:hypothetical protein